MRDYFTASYGLGYCFSPLPGQCDLRNESLGRETPESEVRLQNRATAATISSAVWVQMKGLVPSDESPRHIA